MVDAEQVRQRVGRAIARWRKRHAVKLGRAKYSRAALAAHLKVVERTVIRWEAGESCPDAVELAHMADLFGCEIAEFFV